MYDAARSVLGQELDALGAGGPSDSVLEIGPGTGYWTQMCMERGITHLTAVDITDVRFPDLKQRYPGYEFIAADACHEVPEGPFSLILLLDVIEHIVTEQGLRSLLGNLERAAQANGLIAISFPPPALGRHDLYYLRFWPTGHVVQLLGHSVLVREVPFRDGTLLLFRRGGGAGTGEAG